MILDDIKKINTGKKAPIFNTETMLSISEIQHDTIIMKDGGLRGVIKVGGVNIELKNNEEIEIIIAQYKKLLNGLDFPIQLLIRNTYLDLTPYISYVQSNAKDIHNQKLLTQADGYVDFLQNIQKKTGLIFTKEFYIVVPYYGGFSSDIDGIKRSRWQKIFDALSTNFGAEQIVSKYRIFLDNKKHLDTRCSQVIGNMRGLKMTAERVGVSDIIALLFKVYNPTMMNSQA